jgi:hypothetical protein
MIKQSHGSSLAAEVPYLKRMFSYILHTASDLMLSLDEYGTQVISLLRVNEVHSTSWALSNFLSYIPPIRFVKFLKIYMNFTFMFKEQIFVIMYIIVTVS